MPQQKLTFRGLCFAEAVPRGLAGLATSDTGGAGRGANPSRAILRQHSPTLSRSKVDASLASALFCRVRGGVFLGPRISPWVGTDRLPPIRLRCPKIGQEKLFEVHGIDLRGGAARNSPEIRGPGSVTGGSWLPPPPGSGHGRSGDGARKGRAQTRATSRPTCARPFLGGIKATR